jgi:hypothetical protein
VETTIIAAAIAAVTSLAVALLTWHQNAGARKAQQQLNETQLEWQKELAAKQLSAQTALAELTQRFKQEAEQAKQRAEAQAVLKRYREPLLEDAYYLGDRIHNIQGRNLLSYLDHGEGGKDDIVILSTLFRFARFFGMREIIYAEVNHLKFERDEVTQQVETLLSDIRREFATDGIDRTNGFATSRFMLWVEEQQAIGELSGQRDSNGNPRCIGFATFTENFQERHARWFAQFAADLKSGNAEASERLTNVKCQLASLVRVLDHEQRFTRPNAHNWLTRSGDVTRAATSSAEPRILMDAIALSGA